MNWRNCMEEFKIPSLEEMKAQTEKLKANLVKLKNFDIGISQKELEKMVIDSFDGVLLIPEKCKERLARVKKLVGNKSYRHLSVMEVEEIVKSVLYGDWVLKEEAIKPTFTRLEIISKENGVEYTSKNIENAELSYQDGYNTLKIFLNYKEKNNDKQ